MGIYFLLENYANFPPIKIYQYLNIIDNAMKSLLEYYEWILPPKAILTAFRLRLLGQ